MQNPSSLRLFINHQKSLCAYNIRQKPLKVTRNLDLRNRIAKQQNRTGEASTFYCNGPEDMYVRKLKRKKNDSGKRTKPIARERFKTGIMFELPICIHQSN